MTAPRVRVRLPRTATGLLLAGAFAVTSTISVLASAPSFVAALRHGPGVANHPVHVRPSGAVTIPAGWPLDVDGTITCLTCHETLPSLAGGDAPNLRDYNGKSGDPAAFCRQCHTAQERSAAAMHWMAMGRAHVRDDDETAAKATGLLDAESRRCMECHDGVTAREFNNSTPWSPESGNVGDRRRNHPVGVTYARQAGKRYSSQLRAEILLPAAVRLPSGRVSCVSCHNLYEDTPNHLCVPIEGSKLCFTCHDMD